jgi:hypothetical protein
MPDNRVRQRFSPVFLAELHAIQARRRRYRIEQLLGFLPRVPDRLPSVTPPRHKALLPRGNRM